MSKVLSEIQEKLLRKRIIDIQGDIQANVADYMRECFMRLIADGSPNITIFITSGGGRTGMALDIYDLIMAYPGKKTGVVGGFARSMAVVVLQACDERLALPNSTLLIHHISRSRVELDTMDNTKKWKAVLEDMRSDQKRISSILAKRTGKSLKQIEKECRKDKEVFADKALAFGLLDRLTYSFPMPPSQ